MQTGTQIAKVNSEAKGKNPSLTRQTLACSTSTGQGKSRHLMREGMGGMSCRDIDKEKYKEKYKDKEKDIDKDKDKDKDQRPKTKDQRSKTKDQRPKTKRQR